MKLTAAYLAGLAVEAIPHLDVVGIRGKLAYTSDYASVTIIDSHGKQWRVRYPLNSFASTALEAEAALAPELLTALQQGDLTFDVMRPAGFSYTQEGRALVYPEPYGKTISFDNMTVNEAQSLARTIATIHMLPPRIISRSGLPTYTNEEWRRRLQAELSDANHTGHIPSSLHKRWDDILNDRQLWNFTPTVVHGDVDSENFLWARQSITTVMGWGEAHVGDPALDLASLMSIDDDLLHAALISYEHTRKNGRDEKLLKRAQFMNEFYLLRWLMYGVHLHDEDIQINAIKMLKELDDQIADERLETSSWSVESSDAFTKDPLL
ncbi:MAG: phosphotransferase [Actinomycetaceae bacterium]|nr:phosphotransferase [Actinomycetaceae bacterium]